jgi:lysophospholipase L1-like esterase
LINGKLSNMKKYPILFIVSLIINIIVITYTCRLINGLGGIKYILYKAQGKGSIYFEKEYNTKVSIHNNLAYKASDILFIGDSLTDYCEWGDFLNNRDVKNRGIAGDNIRGVINRIDFLTAEHPRKIFLMIGINNISANNSTDVIISDYTELMNKIKQNTPSTTVYIQTLLPTFGRDVAVNSKIRDINNTLERLSKINNMQYINLYDFFTDKNGQLKAECSYDGLHLNARGYDIWKSKIEQLVTE